MVDLFYGGRRAAGIFGVLRVRRMVGFAVVRQRGRFVFRNAGLYLGHADRYVYVLCRFDSSVDFIERRAGQTDAVSQLNVSVNQRMKSKMPRVFNTGIFLYAVILLLKNYIS